MRAALIGFPEEKKRKAISQAAQSPSFFRDILDRFEGSVPGENAIRFFLLSNGFTNDGVEKALKVVAETTRFVEINGDSESYGLAREAGAESPPEQPIQEHSQVTPAPATQTPASQPQGGVVFWNNGKLDFSLSSSGLAVTGKANSRKAVDSFADKLKALAALLPDEDDDATAE